MTSSNVQPDNLIKQPDSQMFLPVRVMDIEIGEPLPSIPHIDQLNGQEYSKALVLVRLHTQPLGSVHIEFNGAPARAVQVGERIWADLSTQIHDHMSRDGIDVNVLGLAGLATSSQPRCLTLRTEFLTRAPLISVVIATHDRATSLARTLDSLGRLEYPSYEVIVVDNAPSSDATRALLATKYPTVRYVREDQAGLAVAHNRGLMEVTAPIVAFTDDDVEVDSHWLTTIAEAFDLGPDVACVTGMILPAELHTPAQLMIEEYGYSKGFARRVFDLKINRPSGILYPYTAGVFGSGANMAFRTSAIKATGGFDPALGAGSLAKGGDDLSGFFNIVVAGYQLVYQPASILRHWHRREYDALLRQAYGYGVGLTAYLTSVVFHQPLRFVDMALRAPFGLVHALRLRTANAEQRAAYPMELARTERHGMLAGPAAYIRSVRKCAQIKRINTPMITSGTI
jgi:GT2 family glycosyltransferase